jgi:hypothetical protein
LKITCNYDTSAYIYQIFTLANRYDITEILLKVALNTTILPPSFGGNIPLIPVIQVRSNNGIDHDIYMCITYIILFFGF